MAHVARQFQGIYFFEFDHVWCSKLKSSYMCSNATQMTPATCCSFKTPVCDLFLRQKSEISPSTFYFQSTQYTINDEYCTIPYTSTLPPLYQSQPSLLLLPLLSAAGKPGRKHRTRSSSNPNSELIISTQWEHCHPANATQRLSQQACD